MSTNLWTKVNNISFKAKATFLATVFAVLPVIVVGGLSYIQIVNANQKQANKNQKEGASRVADKLNRFMFERNGDVGVLAQLPALNNNKVVTIVSQAEKVALLDRFVESYQVYDSIALFDLNGDPIVESSNNTKSSNHADREYFQTAIKTGKVVISSPEKSKTTGKLSIYTASVVRDAVTKQVIGVVRTRIPVERLYTVAEDLTSKWENYHILDRRSNRVFMSSNGEFRDKPATAEITTAQDSGIVVSHQSKAADRQYTNPTKAIDGDRTELLAAAKFSKIKGIEQLPWTAIATIDEEAAYLELQGLLLTILAGTGITTAIVAGLSTVFADRITKYIQRAISTITLSTNEIVDTVQLQEVNVNEQANSAIATTDTINELESISAQTAEQASASATGARQALFLAEEGTQAVQQTLRGMSGLQASVDEIAQQVVDLGDRTGQITTVSDLVADIAKQTNMLALKAAVEAARVGEQGKGFGVVAGEIRKLAEESKKSAQKINTLATDIQAAINRTVMVTDRGTKTVKEGIQLAENTAATFMGVTDAVNNVFLNSQQISSSAKQQATAIQQVLGAMTAISDGSQESAVGMHRVKTSTKELNQIADELQAAVS
jgi:methyl-accepting chemotaxis protein